MVKFYNGNVKVGDMLTFNKLAGNTELNGCKGSCGKYCKGCWNANNWKKSPCYVAKSYTQYKDNVINSHIVNTIAMRKDPWATIKELDKQLSRKRKIKPIRQHASGELESVDELKAWLWLANRHSNIPIYVYTKAYDIVDAVLTEYQEQNLKLPKNYFINISIWHENGLECYLKWGHLKTVRAFVYDDGEYDYGKEKLELKTYCPAYKKNDKGVVKLSHELTCDKCKLCFSTKNKILGCLSH